MDRKELGIFLRARRESLRPADVGTVAGARRRTPGLRREEVALLADMSSDYYERLEQNRGPNPSEAVLASLARALRLSTDERDHLYVLAGRRPPEPHQAGGYIDPGLMYLLDSLTTIPAMIVDDLGTVLAQNPMNVALIGEWAGRPGWEANAVWRWFTDPTSRDLYTPETHPVMAADYVGQLRASVFRRGQDPVAMGLVKRLLERSPEFACLWESREVASIQSIRKTILHPAVGRMDVQCDVVLSPTLSRRLFLFRPQPGSDTAEQYALLRVLGTQSFAP